MKQSSIADFGPNIQFQLVQLGSNIPRNKEEKKQKKKNSSFFSSIPIPIPCPIHYPYQYQYKLPLSLKIGPIMSYFCKYIVHVLVCPTAISHITASRFLRQLTPRNDAISLLPNRQASPTEPPRIRQLTPLVQPLMDKPGDPASTPLYNQDKR